MKFHLQHPAKQLQPPVQPLPEEFPPALRDIDDRLAQAAVDSAAHVSHGLAERMFNASVGLLPHEQVAEPVASGGFAGRSGRRLVAGGPLVFRRAAWSQLALAASVAMAFGIAVWFLKGTSRHQHHSDQLVSNNSGDFAAMASALDQLAFDSASDYDHRLRPLLDTHSLKSPDDITRGVVSMMAQLGL